MPAARRALRWLAGGALSLVLVLALGLVLLLRTQPGHDFILRTAIDQAPRFVNGDVQIGGIRSDGILGGMVLHGVAIADPRGRSFVSVDSLRVRYSFGDILRGNVALAPVEVWGPQVIVERLHGDARSNVATIFGGENSEPDEPDDPDEESPNGGGTGISLVLRRAVIHDGTFVLRQPVDESAAETGRFGLERLAGVGGGLYRVMRFESIQASIPEAVLAGPGARGLDVRIDDLALVGWVFDEPFVLDDVRGDFVQVADTLRFDLDRLRLPGSELAGELELAWGSAESGIRIAADFEAKALDFDDLRWIEPRLPDGTGEVERISVSGPLGRSTWRFAGANLNSEGSEVEGDLEFQLGTPFRIVEADLVLSPLELEALDPWLENPLPLVGSLDGWVRANGPFSALGLSGDLTFRDRDAEIPPTAVDFAGQLHLGDEIGATDLDIRLDPLRYGTLSALIPGLDITGYGSVVLSGSGRLSEGVELSGRVVHGLEEGSPDISRFDISGRVLGPAEDIRLQLAATLESVSVAGVAGGFGRQSEMNVDVSGSLIASGPLSDLAVTGNLSTSSGGIDVRARIDARDPVRRYEIDGEVRSFALHDLFADLPEPSVVSGDFYVDGSGFDLDALRGEARVSLRDSRVARIDLDEIQVAMRAQGGRLLVDEILVRSPVLSLSGNGDLALREGSEEGEVSIVWAADSLSALRPILFDDTSIQTDTLTALDRQLLELDGIDPDTLTGPSEFALAGSASGELTLRGGVRDIYGQGFVELDETAYGRFAVARARADLRGGWESQGEWEAEAVLDFDSLGVGRFAFDHGSGGVGYAMGAGDFDLIVERTEDERYEAAGTVVRDSVGVDVELQSAALLWTEARWRLAAPARVHWEESRIEFDSVGLAREAEPDSVSVSPASLFADGVLDFDGESDFRLDLVGVDLERAERVAQSDALPGGIVDLSLDIEGPAGSPRMDGEVSIRDFSLDGTRLSLLEGTVSYSDLEVRTVVTGERDGRPLLRMEGLVPADLSFRQVEDRFPDREINLTIVADSLPAATALAFLEMFEDVEGVVDGRIDLTGTPEDLRPNGSLRLEGGAFTIPGIGIEPREITAELRVREDFAVEVDARARADGTAQVNGTISLSDLTDPGFDLTVVASGFHAIDRRDLTARLGGEVSLGGSFNAPIVSGDVTVERGELFLEEFTRGAEVLDLSNPAFFDVVDTTLVSVQPVVRAAQNPFLQNLRVEVDMSLERDVWIRSQGETQGMDVELAGDLSVTFDRPAREILLVGNLQAVRGTYTQFGRQFDVQAGTVEFIGTPGINPLLGIQAIYRLRRTGDEALNIIANLEGTLQSPQVSLTSDSQPPIPESDLISYLIFGRPSYALASGESSVVESALSELITTGLNLGVSQLGSVFSRRLGVDYFSVTQAQDLGGIRAFSDFGGRFADTQIEMGRYLGDDLFFALLLRPLTGLGAARSTRLPGARVEWAFMERWSLEGYLEDRLARQAGSGFGELDSNFSRVVGISLFRTWGY